MKRIAGAFYYVYSFEAVLECINIVKTNFNISDFEISIGGKEIFSLDGIDEMKRGNEIELLCKSGDKINIYKLGSLEPIIAIKIIMKKSENFVRELSKNFTFGVNFICGFVFDADDVFWQSMDKINIYKNSQKDYSDLVKGIDLWGKECIDLSYNYGRRKNAGGILYMAAPIMYFSKPAFAILHPDILMSFKDCESVIKEGNLIIINLTKTIINQGDFSYRDRQEKFWKYFDLENKIKFINSYGTYKGFPYYVE